MSELGSWALGTLHLWPFLLAAVVTARWRPASPGALRSAGVLGAGLLATGLQLVHFGEELATGFPARFPALLGLPPWSPASFAAFNGAWLLLWVGCLAALAAGRRPLRWPLWFLAFALVLNLVAHPLLSLRLGGYFPGLWTSPAVGLAGVLLWRRLLRASSAPPASG